MRLLSRRRFALVALRHRIVAAIEHLTAIERVAPATLIDVGANKGQFSLAVRALRPSARIIAFEPLADAADAFESLFKGDDRVTLHRHAIANREGTADFHVTDRADSSSLLRPGDGQNDAFHVSRKKVVCVPVKRLDDVIDWAALAHPVLMKIDVQGAELEVVKSCGDLTAVDFICAELSYVELYEGQPLFDEFVTYMEARGFAPAEIYNQVSTPAFGLTQADVLFARTAL